jgi:very-short-patch-repair endonuclease
VNILLPSREKVSAKPTDEGWLQDLLCSHIVLNMRSVDASLRHAKRMRRSPTFTERRLWTLLRDRRLDGLKFRRQVPIGPYIVDFVSFTERIVVEADGPMHDATADRLRDDWLQGQRFRVLRFPSDQITLHPDVVLDEIRRRAGLAT